MFVRLFSTQPIAAQVHCFQCHAGRISVDDQAYDAYLVTGSKADSFGTDPWIQTLKTYLLSRYERGDKLLGVCFAINCRRCCWAARASVPLRGWGVGTHQYAGGQGAVDEPCG